jgi:hypothetical protein
VWWANGSDYTDRGLVDLHVRIWKDRNRVRANRWYLMYIPDDEEDCLIGKEMKLIGTAVEHIIRWVVSLSFEISNSAYLTAFCDRFSLILIIGSMG